MTDTLRRLARLRHLEESQAQRALAEARDAEARCAADAAALQERMTALRASDEVDADELARRHATTLRMEMARRRQVRQAQALAQRVERSTAKLRSAVQESRKADRFVEVVEEREAKEAARADQARLDDLGTRSWLRRRAA